MSNSEIVVPLGDFPIGTILPFSGALNAQAFADQGWLYCNGNTVLRSAYTDLFSVIASAYGAGDGRSTFNLPDFRGTFLRGVSGDTPNDPNATTRTAAASGGNTGNLVGSVQGAALGTPKTALVTNDSGTHTHTANHIPTENSSYAMAGSYQAIWNDGTAPTDSAGEHTHAITLGGDSESRPVNIYTYFLIKYKQV